MPMKRRGRIAELTANYKRVHPNFETDDDFDIIGLVEWRKKQKETQPPYQTYMPISWMLNASLLKHRRSFLLPPW